MVSTNRFQSTAEIVHSESKQKVTKLGKSLILDRAKSTSLVSNIRPFISVLGTVIPLRGATQAFDRRRWASKESSRLKLRLTMSFGRVE